MVAGAGAVTGLAEKAQASPGGKGGGTNCPPGFTACGSVCRDTNADATNCGTCGNACPDWQVCRGGACVPLCAQGQHVCAAGTTAVCTDTGTDPNNCGACGNVCPTGQTCVNGTCTTTAVCTPGATQACNTGLPGVCSAGTATCGPDGQWGTCVENTQPASGYCDGLDHDCDGVVDTCGAGQTCTNGMCTTACPTNQIYCGGVCVDPMSDPNNCGGCGQVCTSTPCTSAICQSGQCAQPAVAPGTSCGAPTCASGTATSYICDGNGNCTEVSTSCAPYLCNQAGTGCATSCGSDLDCVAGYTCSSGLCVATAA